LRGFAENRACSILNKIVRIVVLLAPLKEFSRLRAMRRALAAGATVRREGARTNVGNALHYRNARRRNRNFSLDVYRALTLPPMAAL